ncbi:hypothetical protein NY2A_b241L [Paramecium bursaria Chlorella virus NY2A]|uniref:Uncharacterized protein b241L n=1 Tax=Paramecium bursaria Chlorella virus NY2A TaxID=46021 RepID=A7IWB6_PBCVN|nr:hypothetical protein NY2A_b241L [Paramecium bursaria Chlorella virus NY2A]YP_001498304.1 hypothetical protein AR158_C222L [Paramecium bursaria Chlorella virus AR158]ABT14640.1 hypothetical protein NY2A_b241L [Paramecium bursaria Chlorella virus NY2A]ABU43768.1 hypothetical protein AR158_C222L [Paramecium bursaria Chlorella virus AR158]
MRPSGSGAAESPKSIDIPLNECMIALFAFALRTRSSPARANPDGNTGRQYVICNSGYFLFKIAMALLRLSTPSTSATAPPSMSKSIRVREYKSITLLYSVTRASTFVIASASSTPLAPPNDIDTSPPALLI